MYLDDSGSGWDSLGHDLVLSILTVLKERKEKASLQAVMQTSRNLRLLGSSLISATEICDASALALYPRHAAALNTMWLRMTTFLGEAHMEPPFMVSWLQATSAACNRLAAITIVHVELPGMLQAIDAATMDSLLASIAHACPSLRCLSIEGIMREEEDLVRAMLSAIGQHLPRICDLQLESADGFEFAIAGIDWEACLPRDLQKFSSNTSLHHELLQQLVQMPSLTEVAVLRLSTAVEEMLEVQSDSCTWRILRLKSGFPSCQDLGRFTSAMPLLHLYCEGSVQWFWGAAEEGPIMAKAAAWLSQIRNSPGELSLWPREGAAASHAGIISALAPLSGPVVSLQLGCWPVTDGTLEELAASLPNVHKLTLWSSSISNNAWDRMLSLSSVKDLSMYGPAAGGNTTPLAQIITFTSAISRPMALTFGNGAISMDDQAGWEAFEKEERRSSGLQQITVRFTQ